MEKNIKSGVIEIVAYIGKPDITRPFLKPLAEFTKSTGVIIDKDLILTNYHVVRHSLRLKCRIPGGQSLSDLRLLGYIVERDIALCRLPGGNLRPLELYPNFPNVEDPVYAVGFPMSYSEVKITSGVVSGFQDLVSNLVWLPDSEKTFLIETTCPINPGNSGGALVDDKGRVIGITNSGLTEAHGVGYAIPIPIVLFELPKLLNPGRHYPQPWQIQTQFIPPYISNKTGIYVVGKFPSQKLPLKSGDIITHINGKSADGDMVEHMPLKAYIQSNKIKTVTLDSGKILEYPSHIPIPGVGYIDPILENFEYYVIMGICITRLTINQIKHAIEDGNFNYCEFLKPQNNLHPQYLISYIFPNSPSINLGVDILGKIIKTINGQDPEEFLRNPPNHKILNIITENYKSIYLPINNEYDLEILEDHDVPKDKFPLLKNKNRNKNGKTTP